MTKAQAELKLRTTLAAISASLIMAYRVFKPIIKIGVATAAVIAIALSSAVAGSNYQKRKSAKKAPAYVKALKQSCKAMEKHLKKRPLYKTRSHWSVRF